MIQADAGDLICTILAEIYRPRGTARRERYEAEAARRGIDIHQLAAAAIAQALAEAGYLRDGRD